MIASVSFLFILACRYIYCLYFALVCVGFLFWCLRYADFANSCKYSLTLRVSLTDNVSSYRQQRKKIAKR